MVFDFFGFGCYCVCGFLFLLPGVLYFAAVLRVCVVCGAGNWLVCLVGALCLYLFVGGLVVWVCYYVVCVVSVACCLRVLNSLVVFLYWFGTFGVLLFL